MRWILINGGFLLAMYFGLFEGIEVATNVVLLIAWVTIIVSPFMLTDSFLAQSQGRKRSVPGLLDGLFDSLVVLLFAWFGYLATAVFYVLHPIVVARFWKRLEQLETSPGG